MLSVELGHLARILDDTNQLSEFSEKSKALSLRIHDAIWNTTVGSPSIPRLQLTLYCKVVNDIFAYETNGDFLSSSLFDGGANSLRLWWSICYGRRKCSRKLSHPALRYSFKTCSLCYRYLTSAL